MDSGLIENVVQEPSHASSLSCLTTTEKKEIFVRALFDYDPTKDSGLPSRGLSFRFGDILHVLNASDSEWWQAQHISPTINFDSANSLQMNCKQIGIIPGKIRVERRNRLRTKRVDFSNNNYIIGSNPSESIHQWSSVNDKLDSIGNEKQIETRNQSLDRYKQCKTVYPTHQDHANSSFMKRISERIGRRGTYTLSKGINGRSVEDNLKNMGTTGDMSNFVKTRSYEAVVETNIKTSCRPVILLGPLKEQVSTKLLEESSLFSACVSHTTRPKGPDEVDGEDFYFIKKEALQLGIDKGEFVEHCESRGNFYGISAESIKKVLDKNVVCLLEVSCAAIPNMQLHDLHPFVILLMPESVYQLSLVIPRYTDEQADRAFKKCQTMLNDNFNVISAVVPLKSLEQAVSCVKGLVNAHCRSSFIWTAKPTLDPSATVQSWRKESQNGRKMQKELTGSLSTSQKALEAI